MKNIIAALIISTLTGCASQKLYTATGGSRADGTVELSYSYGLFEVPKLDPEQGKQEAGRRCAAWGYTQAEPFGGYTKHCNYRDINYNCSRWTVTTTWQCYGKQNH